MSIASEIQRLQQAKADLKSEMESHGVEPGDGTIDTYPPKITDVYNAGYTAGQAEGGGDNTAFWGALQKNGERGNYADAFRGDLTSFDDTTFRPEYDIRPTTAKNMFTSTPITDLKGILERQGVILDFSKCGDLSYMLQNANVTSLGVVSFESASGISGTFFGCKSLKNIDGVILKSDGSSSFTIPFLNCFVLEHCVFSGVIGKNGLSIESVKLDKESITSIINCLSTTTSGLAVTLSKTAVNNAFEGGSTGAEWLTLIGLSPILSP